MILNFSELQNIKTIRSGIIPYSIINDRLYFLFGIHNGSGDLTDFGGGVKKGETCIDGAIREFREESFEFLPEANYDRETQNYKNASAITDGKQMTIIFLKIDEEWFFKASEKFFIEKKKINSPYIELNNVVWISENQLKKLINKKNSSFFGYNNNKNMLWEKVRRFLLTCNIDSFFASLKNK